MKHKKQRIPRSEAMTKAQNFKTPSHSAESQYSATDEFDHSHFYTGKSSPYIGSKIPKCCYLLSVAKTRNPYPPQPFFFTSPFFWEKTQLDVTTTFNGFQLATAFFSTSSSALVFDTSTFATRSFHLG